jgi:GMP synthase (glutamine-hydrolysing)
MSVYDGRCAFLEAERRLISDALERRRPVLGICLGSQLLAATLGAPVVPNLHRELGWHEIYFTPDATGDPLWRGLTEALTTFHWHGDRFGLPADAIPLAWSRLTECQAFRWGESAYGILFHLEVNQRMVTRMTRAFQAELLATGQSPTEIVNAGPTHLPVLERVGTEVFRRWARLLEG